MKKIKGNGYEEGDLHLEGGQTTLRVGCPRGYSAWETFYHL